MERRKADEPDSGNSNADVGALSASLEDFRENWEEIFPNTPFDAAISDIGALPETIPTQPEELAAFLLREIEQVTAGESIVPDGFDVSELPGDNITDVIALVVRALAASPALQRAIGQLMAGGGLAPLSDELKKNGMPSFASGAEFAAWLQGLGDQSDSAPTSHPVHDDKAEDLVLHPAPWHEGTATIVSAWPVQVLFHALASTDNSHVWTPIDGVVVYREEDARLGNYVHISRTCKNTGPDLMIAEIAEVSGEAVADLYASFFVRYIAQGCPEAGLVLNYRDYLDDRGIRPITKGGSDQHRGFRLEDRLSFGKCADELERWKIKGRYRISHRTKRGAKIRQSAESGSERDFDADIWHATRHLRETTASGEGVLLAINITMDAFVRQFLYSGTDPQMAEFMRQALHYDPLHERIEKRLSYHLPFRYRMAAYMRNYLRPVSLASFFCDARVIADGKTQRLNAGRTINQLTAALDHMTEDRLWAGYELSPSSDVPRRSKLDRFLAQRIVIFPPISLLERYEPLGSYNSRAQPMADLWREYERKGIDVSASRRVLADK